MADSQPPSRSRPILHEDMSSAHFRLVAGHTYRDASPSRWRCVRDLFPCIISIVLDRSSTTGDESPFRFSFSFCVIIVIIETQSWSLHQKLHQKPHLVFISNNRACVFGAGRPQSTLNNGEQDHHASYPQHGVRLGKLPLPWWQRKHILDIFSLL
jgi:hypothetical protein